MILRHKNRWLLNQIGSKSHRGRLCDIYKHRIVIQLIDVILWCDQTCDLHLDWVHRFIYFSRIWNCLHCTLGEIDVLAATCFVHFYLSCTLCANKKQGSWQLLPKKQFSFLFFYFWKGVILFYYILFTLLSRFPSLLTGFKFHLIIRAPGPILVKNGKGCVRSKIL